MNGPPSAMRPSGNRWVSLIPSGCNTVPLFAKLSARSCAGAWTGRLSGASVAVWFHRLYSDLGLEGCSSHSGRRTFVTRAAKKCIEAGGSLRDVQQLAGHSHLATTQRYIEGDSEAKRRLVSMI